MPVEFTYQVGDRIAMRGAVCTNPLQIGILKSEPYWRPTTGRRPMRFVLVEVDGREFEISINRIIKETYILKKLGLVCESAS